MRYITAMTPRMSGLVFVVVSFLLWGGALACPFLDAELSTRAGMGLGLYGLSYVSFGLGCKKLGGAVWPMVKRWLRNARTEGLDP